MAIQGIGSSVSVASYAGGQLARQQAERSAQQLEAKAAALAAEASDARKQADSAQRRADEIQIDAGQARRRADLGKQSLASMEGMDRAADSVSVTVDRVARAVETQGVDLYTPAAETKAAAPASPGQIIDVTV